jgi:uncharacterized YkwD family protein
LAAAHKYGEWINYGIISCEKGGTQVRYCQFCQKKESRTLPGGGIHTWDEGKVIQETTCKEFGRTLYTCTVCSEQEEFYEMPTGNHQYTEWRVTYQPPCGGVGQEMRGCKTCDQTWQREFTSTAEHKWSDWRVEDPAPYCIDGSEIRTCANCSKKETRVLKADPNNHKWSYSFGCSVECGTPANGTRRCQLCLKYESFSYDKLPHNYDEDGKCTWCGLWYVDDVVAFEKEVVRLVNIERMKQGLPTLIYHDDLSRIARMKSEDMRKNNYFDHVSPTYGSPGDMLIAEGYRYSICGENIAYGQRTAADVVDAWMNSPGHRANILNAKFTHIGVGLDCEYRPYWTQIFMAF